MLAAVMMPVDFSSIEYLDSNEYAQFEKRVEKKANKAVTKKQKARKEIMVLLVTISLISCDDVHPECLGIMQVRLSSVIF